MKYALKYGTIGGIVMIASWGLTSLIFNPEVDGSYDFSKGEFLGYVAMILALSAVFIGVKNYRDKQLAGTATFGQVFLMGLNIVLVTSIIYVVGWMIYYPNFMADFTDQYSAYQMQQYQESGLSEAELADKKQEMDAWMEMYEQPVVMAGFTFLEIFPIGLVVALISALVLKKKKP